ncbi:hypothetical protein B0H14DRAFT_2618021 [Mycena olivaceomarginata]|nr:hypothetical protein B0H14DRAFT_2618021 [Mycena olivaceomarginata]
MAPNMAFGAFQVAEHFSDNLISLTPRYSFLDDSNNPFFALPSTLVTGIFNDSALLAKSSTVWDRACINALSQHLEPRPQPLSMPLVHPKSGNRGIEQFADWVSKRDNEHGWPSMQLLKWVANKMG